MIFISLGLKLHIPIGATTAILNVVSLLGIAGVCLRLAGRSFRLVPAFAMIGVIAVFPQYEAALKGFNVFPSAFALALTFFFTVRSKPVPSAAGALLMCLLRPDAIVLAVPLLFTLIWFSSERLRPILAVFGCFVLPGSCYFFWRWHYFHLMFPLPFMVKTDFHHTWGLFIPGSVIDEAPYLVFALVVAAVVYGRRARIYQFFLIGSLFLIPALFFINVALLQNLNARYFYFFPIGAALLVATEWNHQWMLPRSRAFWAFVVFYIVAFLRPAGQGFFSNLYGIDEGKRQVAMANELSHVQPRGTMMVTEAGLLPYYSRWVPIDPFGLNTPDFASHFIQPADVAAIRPDLVITHGVACPSKLAVRPALHDRDWKSMTVNIISGLAESGADYEIWTWPTWSPMKEARLIARGEGTDNECWLIRGDFAGREQLDEILSSHGGSEIDSDLSLRNKGVSRRP